MSKKYWCPMCGDVPATPTMGIALLVMHKADCIGFHAIPVVEPLDVPEVTTWGESGGAEAVTCHPNGKLWWRLGDSNRRLVDRQSSTDRWFMSGPSIGVGDVVEAMNWLVRK
jgi:hypothetical protein